MAICERCHHDNPPARESCARCGWYLRWELTGPLANDAVGGAARAGTLTVTLVAAQASGHPSDPLELELAAGGELTLVARVRSEDASLRRFEVTVEGLPEPWWSVEPRRGQMAGACDVEV